MRASKAGALILAAAAASALTAACGSQQADVGTVRGAAQSAALPLATSLVTQAGQGWAVIQMGGSTARHDNFWELFFRPARASAWKLATPPGVASNGGLVVAASPAGSSTASSSTAKSSTATGASLIAGFRPSQSLTFSPLAASTDQAKTWSQEALVDPGLANVPDSLAIGPNGEVAVLTDAGRAELAARLGASWSALTGLDALAKTGAGRACRLTALTAAAFTSGGAPLLAGACGKPGAVGIFVLDRGSWRAVGPVLPGALAHGRVMVLGLATASGRITALLSVRRGRGTDILAAWSDDDASHWTMSAALRSGSARLVSQSLWPGGAAGLVLAGGLGETIAGPGAAWRALPPLPARTATLALGPAGQLQALTADSASFAAWQLGTGSAGWTRLQAAAVVIPYGSSG